MGQLVVDVTKTIDRDLDRDGGLAGFDSHAAGLLQAPAS